MHRLGLIGFPLSHSFSEKYFSEKFIIQNLTNYIYQLFPLNKLDNNFKKLINNTPDLVGLNVTHPYKIQIIDYLDELDEVAKNIGAVNTIKIIKKNNKPYLIGYNTDAMGFMKAYSSTIDNEKYFNALILGSGGASKAVQYVLEQMQRNYLVVSRTPKSQLEISYKKLTPQILNEYKLIINTTPLGMYPNIDECPPISYEHLTANHLLIDLIYNPLKTKFIEYGFRKGAQGKNGLPMLHIQAEESWKIWNNL